MLVTDTVFYSSSLYEHPTTLRDNINNNWLTVKLYIINPQIDIAVYLDNWADKWLDVPDTNLHWVQQNSI